MKTRNRIPLKRLAAMFAAVLVLSAFVPAIAGAMTVTQSSTRPNGFAGQDTYGGKPTRLTWEVSVDEGEPSVKSLTLTLPEGTDLSKSSVDVVTLKGLTRGSVQSTSKVSANTVRVDFSESIEAPSNIRVTVEDIVLPAKGVTFQVQGSADTSAGVQAIPAAKEALVVKPMTVPERLIFMLDQQKWVEKWNSVNFLAMFFKPQMIVASLSLLGAGWLISLLLVGVGFPVAIPLGLALAFAKMSKIAPVRWFASVYVNVIRGTPLFLQIYIAFFGLPLIGVQANKYVLGIIVLALNSSAYLTEIFRAGIQSIAKGQFEAASSLGMSYWQSMQYVIIPQTVKRVLPTMTSEFILLYKDTSLLSAVGVFELMMYSKNLTAITGNVTPYVVAALFYLIVTTPLIRYVQTLELRLAVAEGGATPPQKKRRRWPWQPASAGSESALLASSVEHESR
ncbi:MAG: amino acid ABC transporter permease [Coriobacteriia bacterium]|nr:amino acid ABC transporter permease [Coriobacteriia bacterium]